MAGWSITIAGTFSAFSMPTSRLWIGNWPMAPNSRIGGALASFGIMPLSLAALLDTSVTGAPVSKIIRYGPLPLILIEIAKCFVFSTSIGTVTGFSVFGVSADVGRARAISKM